MADHICRAIEGSKGSTICLDCGKPMTDPGSMYELVREQVEEKVYWCGVIGPKAADGSQLDDFDHPIDDVFIDGKTRMGPWACMSPTSFKVFGIGKLGLGFGQKYQKQADGRWLKVEG